MKQDKVGHLKQRADDGDITAMYEYALVTDDPQERRQYLKQAADNGYGPAKEVLSGEDA
jgi:hypothetical protein